jgi:hypothetical protein
VSALSLSRTIYIIDECALEDRLESTSDEMMDDAITEVARKYLSLHRISHDKCSARLELIASILDFMPKFDALALIMELEFESTIRISLMPSAVIVSSEDVSEGKHNPKNILIILSHDYYGTQTRPL